MSGSGTRGGPGEHAAAVGPSARDMLGRIRRMAITLTSRALWQVIGHLLLDGSRETHDAEVFSGIGFFSRPSSNGKPEAIVVFPGGAGNPIVVAARDEQTRKAIAGALAADETAVFNSQAILHFKAGGTIEARSAGGVAVALATKADVQAVVDWIKKHVHSGVTAGGANSGPPANGLVDGTAPTSPTGTTVLKGE